MLSEDGRQRLIESRRASKGTRTHSEATKQKIREGNTGKVFTPERCAAISAANKEYIDPIILLKLKEMLEEKVCNYNVLLLQFNLERRKRTVARCLSEIGYVPCEAMKFFNPQVDYETGKKLLAYMRLGISPSVIRKKLSLSEKIFGNCSRRLQKAHEFKYTFSRTSCRSNESTVPERIVRKYLEEQHVDFIAEYSQDSFFYDFWVRGTKLLIEVQGDYWHANPAVYKDRKNLNETQKKNVRRDGLKLRRAKDAGFWVLYLWERDIKLDFEAVANRINEHLRIAHDKSADLRIF